MAQASPEVILSLSARLLRIPFKLGGTAKAVLPPTCVWPPSTANDTLRSALPTTRPRSPIHFVNEARREIISVRCSFS
jgi:hypothetical protein